MNNQNNNINNINYDDPDAFLKSGVFNSEGYVQRRKDLDDFDQMTKEIDKRYLERQQKSMISRQETERNIRKFQQSKSKTIGNRKITKDAGRRNHPEKRKNNTLERVAITMCTFASVVALSIPIGMKVIPIIQDKIETQQNIENSTNYLTARAYNALAANGLAGIDIETGEFKIKENSIIDYRKLGVVCNTRDTDSHLEVYIYKLILPNSEFDKFIKAVSYDNGLHYYTDMNQFLNINGYYAKGTNTPSFDVFSNMMEEEVNKISSQLLKEYAASGGIYTVQDYLEDENKDVKGR